MSRPLDHRGLAVVLRDAERARQARAPLTDDLPGLDVVEAYRVQRDLVALRVAEGERVVGVKLGLTSPAKQRQMGVDTPLTAVLTDRMALTVVDHVPLGDLIHPRIEPEIAFVMRDALAGPGVTAARAMAAVGSVHAAFEVIDSRFEDFRFTLPDVIADNASAARFFVSALGVPPASLDLALEAVVLAVNGVVTATATGAAVLGSPGEALALAANDLAVRGERIEAGAIVLTGALTDAVPLERGDEIRAEFTTLRSLVVSASSIEKEES